MIVRAGVRLVYLALSVQFQVYWALLFLGGGWLYFSVLLPLKTRRARYRTQTTQDVICVVFIC